MGGAGGGKKKGSNSAPGSQLRGGMKHGNVNAKTMCKIDHLKDLALWTAAEASVPSLGAFFGERFAASIEELGLRADPSFFVCERCESILQPGNNCSVRIEKNKSKGRSGRKKSNCKAQNYTVYRCHSCSHRNLMRGTTKGYIKEICPPKPKPTLELKKARETTTAAEYKKVDSDALLPLDGQNLETSCPATPLPSTGPLLLNSKRRKRNSSCAKKVAEPQISPAVDSENCIQSSRKRRKKSWTSLKQIAESSEQDIGKKLTDLTVPCFI